MTAKIQACLWLAADIQEAADFYAATFPDSRIVRSMRAPGDYPAGRQGDVLTIEMTIFGMPFLLLGGGPGFNMGVSFQVAADDQAQTDLYWHAITRNGGEEGQCGWCRDRFGLWWQVAPRRLTELMLAGGEPAARAFAAMMSMRRIDIAALDRAVAGH